MSRAPWALMTFILLFSLDACSTPPAPPTQGLTPALTSLPTFTPPAPLTDTPLPDIPSSFTPTVSGMPADFSPILYGRKYEANTFFLLLGGLRGDVWLAPELAAAQFQHPQTAAYDVYTFAGNMFQVQGHSPQFSPAHKTYTIGTDETVDEFGMVAVAQGWPVLKREVQELASDNALYQQILLDWLAAEGIATPELGALRVFRVDLEGDGVDEIFISANHLDGSQHMTKSGDYSVVLMRKVQGNDAVTLPVVGDVYYSQESELTFPKAYSLGNFIDLNRDGVLDVVIDIQRWEGDGVVVYQIDGQVVIESLRVE